MPFATFRKAIVAAVVAFLGPILTFVASTGDWDWRFFIGSVIAGLVAGLGTFQTTNAGTVNGSTSPTL